MFLNREHQALLKLALTKGTITVIPLKIPTTASKQK